MDASRALLAHEPLDRAILSLLETVSGHWSDVAACQQSAIDGDASDLLIRSGLLEARCICFFTMDGMRPREVRCLLRVKGEFEDRHLEAFARPSLPHSWYASADLPKLASYLKIDLKRYGQLRRTTRGEYAWEKVCSGDSTHVIDAVRRRSGSTPYDAPAYVHVENVWVDEDASPTNPGPRPIAVAQANASVGDTVVHNHIHNHVNVEVPQSSEASKTDEGTASGKGDKEVPHKLRWMATAMMAVQKNPEWSDARIANIAGVDKSTLSRNKTYQNAAAMARGSKDQPPRGQVGTGDFGGRIEAEDPSGDPAKIDWDD